MAVTRIEVSVMPVAFGVGFRTRQTFLVLRGAVWSDGRGSRGSRGTKRCRETGCAGLVRGDSRLDPDRSCHEVEVRL